MVLSVIPCSDVQNECNDTKPNQEMAHNHDHQQDKDDNCSPFCICACCGTSVTVIEFFPLSLQVPVFFPTAPKVALRNFFFVSNFYGNIWQPPKINC
jgi:hypothetical protein